VGSFIRIGPGIEEGAPGLCGGAPRAVIPSGILKCPDPACTTAVVGPTHPKTYHSKNLSRIRLSGWYYILGRGKITDVGTVSFR
jgi:hypothetical protein